MRFGRANDHAEGTAGEPAASRFALRRRQTRTRGQALVEFALALPVLGLIMLGTLDMGQLFFEYIQLRGAVREAAAYGARNPGDDAGMISAVYSYGGDLATGTTVGISLSPDVAASDIEVYDDVTVTVTARRVFEPLTLSFFQQFGMGDIPMSASASAKVWT